MKTWLIRKTLIEVDLSYTWFVVSTIRNFAVVQGLKLMSCRAPYHRSCPHSGWLFISIFSGLQFSWVSISMPYRIVWFEKNRVKCRVRGRWWWLWSHVLTIHELLRLMVGWIWQQIVKPSKKMVKRKRDGQFIKPSSPEIAWSESLVYWYCQRFTSLHDQSSSCISCRKYEMYFMMEGIL